MSKNITLLLVENVDNLGIVGDVVTVKSGFARNFLLPRELATTPDDDLIKALGAKRADAQKQASAQRSERETMIAKMAGLEVTLDRSCNDSGVLYGSVTQQDIAAALSGADFPIKPREVRLPHTIKRLGEFEIRIKLDADLETDITLTVNADRELDLGEREEMEFDNEGELIEKPKRAPRPAPEEAGEARAQGEPAAVAE